MNTISFSKVESDRFGLVVYRGHLDAPDAYDLKSLIRENKVDILILRLPTSNKLSHVKLAEFGFDYLHADTLVYYDLDLPGRTIPGIVNDLNFERITDGNRHLLENIIPDIFHNYSNHYSSNLALDPQKIAEGYVEWARVSSSVKTNLSWYAMKNRSAAGFIICSLNEQSKECEVVLNGVLPDHMGRGIYSDMIRYLQMHLAGLGYKRITISTQLNNSKVQRVWTREGFSQFNAFETYHINPFLSNPSKAKRK